MKKLSLQLLRKFTCSLILTTAFASAPLFGATLNVTNAADSGPGTLRERIAAANPNDKIDIIVSSPIILNSELVISKNLRIDNFGGPAFKLSGNSQTRIFNVTSGLLELHGLPITDGRVTGTNGAAGASGETVSGGAILVASGANLSLENCVFSNNVAQGGPGGGPGQFDTAGNGGNGFGGAIGGLGTIYLVRSIFTGNSAIGGTGGVAPSGFPGSGGQGWGGAIFCGGNGAIFESALFLNHAIAGAGGGGPGGAAGGAIYNQGTLDLNVSTIVTNTASGSSFDFGGAVHHGGSSLSVYDCTIVGNQAGYGGGITGGEIINTILAGNSAANGPDGLGNILSAGINLIQNTNGIALSGAVSYCIFGQDPLLGPLKDNGSYDTEFTPPNMMPLPGSPVIDKGSAYYNFDQRRYHRPYDNAIPNTANGSDIGAIEVHPNGFIVVNTNNSGPGSLRQAISDNNGFGGDNVIMFSNTVTGTIKLSGAELAITAPVSIVGPGAASLAVSGNDSVRVFSVLDGHAQISGLTICNGLDVGAEGLQGQDGYDGRGAGIYNQDMLTLRNCTVRSNRVVGGIGGERHLGSVGKGGKGMGAAIYNANGVVKLESCSIEDNSATGGQGGPGISGAAGSGGNTLGGAISTGGGSLTLNLCRFMNNVATGGAGGSSATPGIGGQGYGGALYTDSGTEVVMTTFARSTARGGSGGGGNGSGYGGCYL